MNRTIPLSRPVVVVVLLLLLSGCAVKFIYNQMDWIIPWYLDDYVTLNSRQENMLDVRLTKYLAWHRKEELPAYAAFIEWVAEASADGLSMQELDQLFTRSESLTNRLFTPLSPSFIDIFADLSDAQIDEVGEKLRQKNREYIEKYIDTAEARQRQKRAGELREFIERWTDELNEQQVEMIERWSQDYALMGEEFLQSRRQWQQRFFQILQRRQERDYLADALNELFTASKYRHTPAHAQKLKSNEQLLKKLYLDLDRSLDSYQRSQLERKLRAYAEDFVELSLQAKLD